MLSQVIDQGVQIHRVGTEGLYLIRPHTDNMVVRMHVDGGRMRMHHLRSGYGLRHRRGGREDAVVLRWRFRLVGAVLDRIQVRAVSQNRLRRTSQVAEVTGERKDRIDERHSSSEGRQPASWRIVHEQLADGPQATLAGGAAVLPM